MAQAKRASRNDRTEHRSERVPVGFNRNILTVSGLEDGYVYRWVNDIEDRIIRFKQGGYEVVENNVKVGDETVNSSEGVSSTATYRNVGGGVVAYLMRIPREFYDEDFEEKMKHVNSIEESTKDPISEENKYGNINIGT
jgi:hypothetical protein